MRRLTLHSLNIFSMFSNWIFGLSIGRKLSQLSFSYYKVDHLINFFAYYLFMSFAHFSLRMLVFSWFLCFLKVSVYSFYIRKIHPLSTWYELQIFYPICHLSFENCYSGFLFLLLKWISFSSYYLSLAVGLGLLWYGRSQISPVSPDCILPPG